MEKVTLKTKLREEVGKEAVKKLRRQGFVPAVVYLLVRCMGSYAGARLGARWVGADDATAKWIGLCLFPQAGVALGMALMASQRFPALEPFLLPVVLASTVIYELFSPAITRRALLAAGR